MKIVVTATSPSLDSPSDARFGRAAYFIVVNTDTLEWQAYPNPARDSSGGAGTQASQFIVNQGVQVAISGDLGPNAYSVLNVAGLTMYLLGASKTVREAVEYFNSHQLVQVGTPTSTGHHRLH
jgi:predicted Fe-Mo cluster-binding NifX family protein